MSPKQVAMNFHQLETFPSNQDRLTGKKSTCYRFPSGARVQPYWTWSILSHHSVEDDVWMYPWKEEPKEENFGFFGICQVEQKHLAWKDQLKKGGAIHSVFQKKTHQRVEKEPITLNQNHKKLIGTSHLPEKKFTTTTSDGCLFGSHHHHHRCSWSHFRTEKLVQPCSIHAELVLETGEFVEAP